MRVAMVVSIMFLVVLSASGEMKIQTADVVEGPSRLDCITDGYDAYLGGTGAVIPDADPNGLTFGPLASTGEAAIVDVILSVNMSATWVGDVRLSLLYDTDCDGNPDVEGSVLCRHSMAECTPDGCCGCSGNLGGVYQFDDTAVSIEDACPTDFPVGCYGPDYKSTGLDVFDGLASGGCWYLFCADGAGGDVTEVFEWGVHVLTESTPVDVVTWGMVKALYR